MSSNVGGHRFVLGLYVALVAVVGAADYLTEAFVSSPNASRFLFLVPLLPTPAGFTAYNALITAFVFGVPLVLIICVSAGLDDAAQLGIIVHRKY